MRSLKEVNFVVALDEDTDRDLREWATEEERSRRNLAGIILRRAIRERQSRRQSDKARPSDTQRRE
jgi:hypothetical protein